MALNYRGPGRTRSIGWVAWPALSLALLVLVACSPEDGRARGQLGADPGNTTLPIELRGNRNRNNPSFQVPLVGQVPRDAKGVGGWWVNRAD